MCLALLQHLRQISVLSQLGSLPHAVALVLAGKRRVQPNRMLLDMTRGEGRDCCNLSEPCNSQRSGTNRASENIKMEKGCNAQ